ncbi:MAG TPA: hypothetical protein VFV50_15940 [Bdellovibrionales bacterium]|nr:hypothetical protein [Bdellovibrionales bacterium]
MFERLARRYRTPESVQAFVRRLTYNKKNTMRSALGVLKQGEAHCLESVFVAAAILERHGHPPLAMCLDSADHVNHVIFIFRERGRWGAIGRSREPGLHGRAPVFRSLRDLAWSYVDPYVDDTGGRLVGYSISNLDDSGSPWRVAAGNVWKCERYVLGCKLRSLRASAARHRKSLREFLNGGHIPRDYWW